MTEYTECKTIYLSPELKQANDSGYKRNREIHIPEVRPQSSHRLNYVQSHDRGLRRSFGSTDLLHNAHPNSHIALASDSADSLEGAVPLHADSSGEHHRPEKLQSTATNSLVYLGDLEMPIGGEGKRKAKAGADWSEDEQEGEDKEENWLETSEIEMRTAGGRQEKAEEEEEEEEEIAASLPAFGQVGKKHQGMVTSQDNAYLQDFHSLPKSLVPSEITHCLYMLEEECRGVEKESESVKRTMEFIHCSMLCVQETLRTLLIRLVEAQSSDHQSQGATPDLVPPPASLCTHPPNYLCHQSNLGTEHNQAGAHPVVHGPHHHHYYHHHHHHLSQCKTPHPVPSKTCLMDSPNKGPCCQGALPADMPMPMQTDMPSCAQRAKEREAAFGAITDLRADVERLRLAHLEERREHQEALRVLKNFQRQVEDLISAQRGQQESCSGPLNDQMQQLKLEVQEVATMTRQAMAVLMKLDVQLQNMGSETNSEQPNSCDR